MLKINVRRSRNLWETLSRLVIIILPVNVSNTLFFWSSLFVNEIWKTNHVTLYGPWAVLRSLLRFVQNNPKPLSAVSSPGRRAEAKHRPVVTSDPAAVPPSASMLIQKPKLEENSQRSLKRSRNWSLIQNVDPKLDQYYKIEIVFNLPFEILFSFCNAVSQLYRLKIFQGFDLQYLENNAYQCVLGFLLFLLFTFTCY